MTRIQIRIAVLAALLIAAFFGVEWIRLPSSLGSVEVRRTEVSATHLPTKGGRAILREATGSVTEVRCGRVRELCDRIRLAPAESVQVEMVRPSVWGDTWLLSAVVDGKELLTPGEKDELYAQSRAMHAALALLFVVIAAVLWRFLPVRGAGTRPR
jgi:hypothetical protein